MTPVHEKLRTIATDELTELLGAEVGIGRLKVIPLTRVELADISIISAGDTLLTAGALNAGISGRNLLMRQRLVVTDVELISPDIRVRRDSAAAPLNIQPIIDKLKGDGSKPPKKFDLAVHTVVIRHGAASYNVDSAPRKADGFDPNHIQLQSLNADITAPKIATGNFDVRLKRLALSETSGLKVRRLAADVVVKDSLLSVSGLELNLGGTNLRFAPMALNLSGHEIGDIEILGSSQINVADAAPILPQLASLNTPLKIKAKTTLFRDSISIGNLELCSPELMLNTRAQLGRLNAASPKLNLGINGKDLAATIALFTELKPKAAALIESLGVITFTGSGGWARPGAANLKGTLTSAAGRIELNGQLANQRLTAGVQSPDLNLGLLMPDQGIGMAEIDARADLMRTGGHAAVDISRLEYRNHTFRNLAIKGNFHEKSYAATIEAADSAVNARVDAAIDLSEGDMAASLSSKIDRLDPQVFGVLPKYAGYVASAEINAAFAGTEPLYPTGQLSIDGFNFVNADGQGLTNECITLTTDFSGEKQTAALTSSLIDADVSGQINLKTVGATIKNILAEALPQYFEPQPVDSVMPNNFRITATVHDSSPILAFISPSVELLYPATIAAAVNGPRNTLAARLSAPYLTNGNSLISHTALKATVGRSSAMNLQTTLPSKFGDMDFNVSGTLAKGNGLMSIAFSNSGEEKFGADIKAKLLPLPGGLDVQILPGILTIGGVDWDVEPAYIGRREKSTVVHRLGFSCPGQELAINGVVSDMPDDRLTVNLDNINVDYIFESLRMAPQVRFGGHATGTVTASGLLSPEPVLQTNNLFVRNFSYGNCILGDATIQSRWNNESRAIEIHADVPNAATNGMTIVNGSIMPLSSELDFVFEASHTPVGFIHTFTNAWASGVSGTASGRAHLFGDFKKVNLEGDFFAENFGITIGFTDVTYTATDSVHIRPGIVDLSGIRVTDPEGHTATLSGALNHRYFLECDFNFRIDNMKNMLVLNTRPHSDEDFWYGTVHADGSVEITGVPGHVGISANVSTASASEFTFVITDAANAAEYTFLTFRDATPAAPSALPPEPGSPELDELMRARVTKAAQTADATNFNFDMQVDVTPQARMTLVMDPDAGDKITGTGAGHIGLVYGSQTDEFRLYGDYRIEKGVYNFSLQDIILKNFQISSGSEIAFTGDPMDARLNISAIYQVNANLSDLDESFLNDKEVQRTNVPVYAVLNVDGQLQDPQISFDLDFPTLTSDVKRKVKSIVSTNDMMNRQIIYLLALNRFYTPDYMAATKGNDLMSVASGTLSSQLSNILGQLSDKISVAPSLRTDNGDFSDVEVDVALSSTLLNNRLLLNGNFGYRDKALNSNQFIGDFDVEYLLTRRGNWRVKAYNHFNDRNLYVKNALTTQGIGLVFKHDFDNLFKNIWKSRKKSVNLQSQ